MCSPCLISPRSRSLKRLVSETRSLWEDSCNVHESLGGLARHGSSLNP